MQSTQLAPHPLRIRANAATFLCIIMVNKAIVKGAGQTEHLAKPAIHEISMFVWR